MQRMTQINGYNPKYSNLFFEGDEVKEFDYYEVNNHLRILLKKK